MTLFCKKMIKRVGLKHRSQTSATKRLASAQGFLTKGREWVSPESLSSQLFSQPPRSHSAAEKHLSTKLLLSFLGSTLCPGPSRSGEPPSEQGEATSSEPARPVKARAAWRVQAHPNCSTFWRERCGSRLEAAHQGQDLFPHPQNAFQGLLSAWPPFLPSCPTSRLHSLLGKRVVRNR